MSNSPAVWSLTMLLCCASAQAQSLEPTLPKPEHGLHYDTPAMVWDEALPLGNGIMGALVRERRCSRPADSVR